MFNNTEYTRKWRKENPEEAKRKNEEYYKKNKQRILDYQTEYRKNPLNIERNKEYQKEYRKNNKDKINNGKRRAYQKSAVAFQN